jgi:type IV secretory pathway VirB2 component (pilin)
MRFHNFCLLFFVFFVLPVRGYCYGGDIDSDMISSVLNSLVDLVTSTPAKILFVLAIIGVGYGTLVLGRIERSRAIGIILGVGIIFSSGYIANQLGLGT